MRAFSKHCEYLGFPLRNARWSWGAISSDRKRVLFTIWSDQVVGRRFVLYPIAFRRPDAVGAAADLKPGGREMADIAAHAADQPGVTAFGVLCVVEDPAAVPRTRKSFDGDTVFKLRVVREGNSIVAEFQDRISVETVKAMAGDS